MLKTLAAAVLAVSVTAAPAMAAAGASAGPASAVRLQATPAVLEANAKMGNHQYRRGRHSRHYRRQCW